MLHPKFLLLLPLFLFATAAHADNCTDRDYRGLKLDAANPPIYSEAVCQLKLILKNRNNADSLNDFVSLHGDMFGVSTKDLNWQQPLVLVINDLINDCAADKNLPKLAQAAQQFYGPGSRYVLEKTELSVLDMLAATDLQHGGHR